MPDRWMAGRIIRPTKPRISFPPSVLCTASSIIGITCGLLVQRETEKSLSARRKIHGQARGHDSTGFQVRFIYIHFVSSSAGIVPAR